LNRKLSKYAINVKITSCFNSSY